MQNWPILAAKVKDAGHFTNVSKQAMMIRLQDLGLVAANESAGVKSTLTAAAWSYVSAALASVAMLLYYLSMLRR